MRQTNQGRVRRYFAANAVHQPLGLIAPETMSQVPKAFAELPGWKNRQPEHLEEPLGCV